MSLSILLSPADRVYHPGSALRGTVFLTSLTSIAIGSLSITLTGRSRVTLTQNYGDLNVSNSEYHSRAILFQHEQSLYTGGKWTHQAGQYSWEFDYVVPTSTDPRYGHGSQCPFLATRDLLQGGGGIGVHPLPPSMLYGCRNFTCLVEYVLEVRLAPPSGSTLLTKALTAKVNIIVQPDRDSTLCIDHVRHLPYARHDQVLKVPKSKLRALEQSPLSRLLKLSKSPQQNANQVASSATNPITVSVCFPGTIDVAGEYSTVDILLSAYSNSSIDAHTQDQTQVATPNVTTTTLTMKSMKITIIQYTHVQAGNHTSTSTRKTYTRKTTCSLPVQVRSGIDGSDQGATEAQCLLNLGKVTGLRIAKEFLVLDFMTGNISIDHALDLELGFEYEGGTAEFVRREVPIKVVVATFQNVPQVLDRAGSESVSDHSSGRTEDVRNSASSDRPEQDWLVPPPEGGLLERETDACFSAPPPRYMLRAS